MEPVKPDSAAELADLFPQPVSVQIADRLVTIDAFTIEQTGRVARALKPVVASLAEQGERSQNLLMYDLLADHTEALTEAAAIATGEPVEWIRQLKFDQFLALVFAIGELNLDFFVRRVGPALNARLGAMGSLGLGPTH